MRLVMSIKRICYVMFLRRTFASVRLTKTRIETFNLYLIYCYKIVFGLVAVNIDDFLSLDLPGALNWQVMDLGSKGG